MKTVQFDSFGEPHKVAYCADLPDVGDPASDEVVVEVEAFPINPADLLFLAGAYASRPQLPATPGAEGVGRIAAVGDAVSGLTVDDRVILLCRENWAQQRRVKADQVLKVPRVLDVLQTAMLKVNPATALLMLREYRTLRPGDWLIQDAANSGVGTSLIRLAKADGIRTVNVVRREELIEPLRALGADVVVVDGDSLVERVSAATSGAEIGLAIDAVAGETCLRLAECLVEGGVVVNYGMLSGKPCMVTPERIVFGRVTLTGFWLARHLSQASRDEVEALYGELAEKLADETLKIDVEATYPIEDIGQALVAAAREGRDGKILITPNGPIANR